MITILIASYNHVQYIEECLSAATKINITGKKIIVIDDGSTDGTIDVINKFIADDPSIQFLAKSNSGLVSSLNLGLQMATTPFFYLTASDDVPVAAGLEKLVRLLEEDPLKDFIIGGASNFFEDGTVLPTYTKKHDAFFSLSPHQLYNTLFCGYPHPILLQSTVFKTDFLKQLGGWDADLILDDYPMFIKAFSYSVKNKKEIIFRPDIPCTNYRHHSNNSYKRTLKQFNMVYATILKYAPSSLLNKAKGDVFSYYLVQALRNKDFKSLFGIARNLNAGALFYTTSLGIKKALRVK